MADEIRSTIYLEVITPEPDLKGFASVLSSLEAIEKKLYEIGTETWKINLVAELKTEEIQKFLDQANLANKMATEGMTKSIEAKVQEASAIFDKLKAMGMKTSQIQETKVNGSTTEQKFSFENLERDQKFEVSVTEENIKTIEKQIDANLKLEQTAALVAKKRIEYEEKVQKKLKEGMTLIQSSDTKTNGVVTGSRSIFVSQQGQTEEVLLNEKGVHENIIDFQEQAISLENLRKKEIQANLKIEQDRLKVKQQEVEYLQAIDRLNKQGFKSATQSEQRDQQGRLISQSATFVDAGGQTARLTNTASGGVRATVGAVNDPVANEEAQRKLQQGVLNREQVKNARENLRRNTELFARSVARLQRPGGLPDNAFLGPVEAERKVIGKVIDQQTGKLVDEFATIYKRTITIVGDGFIREVQLRSDRAGKASDTMRSASAKEIERLAAKTLGDASQQLTDGQKQFFTSKLPVQQPKRVQSRADFDRESQKALSEGFTRSAVIEKDVNGTAQKSATFIKIVSDGLRGYTVLQRKVSEVTGEVTEQTLEGAAAYRQVGDTVDRAAKKIAIWATATSLVFGAVQAIKMGVQFSADLEENAILMARVGAGLGSDFSERLAAARELTRELVAQTTAIGGNAAEAQHAAAVFLRAGQSQQETLSSTRAAMLASKIAEMGMLEAAELLSAAQLQFNLTGSETLIILDQLNALSNRYRVTTDALMQSISRTGGVYAEQNGSLQELAATTAVLSQRTARSGAEIGNALKTIVTRLSGEDVQAILFDKLGISVNNAQGELKSLNELLLEIQYSMLSLTQAEQQEITTAIAGTRQKNILVAALNSSVEALVAEARSYGDTNSAQEEAKERSESYTSALERLQASLLMIANESGPVLLSILTKLANSLALVSKIVSVFGGNFKSLIAVVIAGATVLKVISVAVRMFGLSSLVAAGNQTALAKAVATGTVMLIHQVRGAGAASAALNSYRAATTAAGVATAAFNPVILLVAVGLSALVYGLSAANEQMVESGISASGAASAFASFIAEQENAVKAATKLTQAIQQEIELVKELRKLEESNKDGKQNSEVDKRRKEIQREVKAIQEALAEGTDTSAIAEVLANTTGKTAAQIEEALEKAKLEVQRVATRRASEARQRLDTIEDNRRREVSEVTAPLRSQFINPEKAFNNPERAQQQARRREAFQKEFGEFEMGGMFGNSARISNDQIRAFMRKEDSRNQAFTTREIEEQIAGMGFDDPGAVARNIRESIIKFRELDKTVDDAKKNVEELEKAAQGMGSTFDKEFLNAKNSVKSLLREFEQFNADSIIRRGTLSSIGFSEEQMQSSELQKMVELQKQLNKETEVLRERGLAANGAEIDKIEEKLLEVNDAVKQLSMSLEQAAIKRFGQTLRSQFDSVFSLRDAASKAELRIQRGEKRSPAMTAALDDINRREKLLQDEVNRRAVRADELKGSTDPNAQAEFSSNVNAASDANLKLQELIREKYAAQRELVADITEQKREQRKETEKELGLLSSQDKLRAMLLAQEVQDRKGKQFTQDELFFMGSEKNALLQKLFPEMMPDEPGKPGANPITDFILGAKGDSRDVRLAEGRLGGINRDSATQDAARSQRQIEQLERDRRRMLGIVDPVPIPGDTSLQADQNAGMGRPNIPNINAQFNVGLGDAFLGTFNALADRFTNVASAQLAAAEVRINQRLDKMEADIKTTGDKKRIPRINQNQ